MDNRRREESAAPDSTRTAKFLLEVAAYVFLFVTSVNAVLFLAGVLVFDFLTRFNAITWAIVVPVFLFFLSLMIVSWKKMPVLRRKP